MRPLVPLSSALPPLVASACAARLRLRRPLAPLASASAVCAASVCAASSPLAPRRHAAPHFAGSTRVLTSTARSSPWPSGLLHARSLQPGARRSGYETHAALRTRGGATRSLHIERKVGARREAWPQGPGAASGRTLDTQANCINALVKGGGHVRSRVDTSAARPPLTSALSLRYLGACLCSRHAPLLGGHMPSARARRAYAHICFGSSSFGGAL